MQIVKKYFVKQAKDAWIRQVHQSEAHRMCCLQKAESIMKSKGYQRFSTRLIYFRQDIEVVDVFLKTRKN